MEVRICDNAGCTGDALWCEKHNGVTVREGQFNLLLGDGDGGCGGSPAPPTGPISADIFTQPDRWVELKVGGTVMTPRQRLAAVPYAMSATYATTLSAPDGDPEDAVTVGNTGDVTVKEGNVTLETGNVRVVQGGVCIDSDGSCSPPGDAGLRANGDVYLANNSGAKVGIGKTNPQTTLDVAGDASVSGALGIGTTSPDKPLTIKGTGANSEWISFQDKDGTTQWHLNYSDTGLNFVETGEAGGRLFLDDGGKVGIGTRNPQSKLDVDGDIRWDGHLTSFRRSGDYTASHDADVEGDGWDQTWMWATQNSVCFLNGVKCRGAGGNDEACVCDIVVDSDGGTNKWRLKAFAEEKNYTKCKACCIGW
jgi:hypothetical protein